MTSPDSKATPQPQGEGGGGILPALLAGAGILAVAALFIFGGDDDKEATRTKDATTAQAASAQSKQGPNSGVAARNVDDANALPRRPTPRLNPRIASSVITEGMAPTPNKKPEPTSWDSVEEEIAYWESELVEANRMLEIRQRASEHVPVTEEKIREQGTPDELAQFQARKQIVEQNLEKAQARVDEIEGKLQNLRGG